jgi:hypothetical protein
MKQLMLAAVGFERYAKTLRRGVSGLDGSRSAVAGAVRTDRAALIRSRGNGRPPVGNQLQTNTVKFARPYQDRRTSRTKTRGDKTERKTSPPETKRLCSSRKASLAVAGDIDGRLLLARRPTIFPT